MSNYQSAKIIYHKIYKQLQQNHQYLGEHFLPTLQDTKHHLQLIKIDVMLHYLVYYQYQKYLALYTYLHPTKNNHQRMHVSYLLIQRQINLLHYNDNQLPNDNLQDSKCHMTDFVYLIQHQEAYSLLILYNNENLEQMNNYQYLALYTYLHPTKNNHQRMHVSYLLIQRQINLLHYNDNQLPNDNLQDSKCHMTDFVYLIQHQEAYSLLILYNNENLEQMNNY